MCALSGIDPFAWFRIAHVVDEDRCPAAFLWRIPKGKRTAFRRMLAGEKEESRGMLDVFMLVIGIGFFAAAVAYAFACDRL
jgi:hypothetical protein